MSQTKFREIAPVLLFDTSGRLLLQLRDEIPSIIYPGKIGLFGGHREGNETFLECAVREIREELNFYLPPERFQCIASRSGPDSEVPGGTVRAEIFVARDVPVAEINVIEGSLKIVPTSEVSQIEGALTPYAKVALVSLGLLPARLGDHGGQKA
jgi:8-oxo-dGTP diphosphatase